MKHVLCAHIPRWSIDRLCRRRPELRHKPLALIETIGNRQMVIHVSAQTPRTIHPGLTLTEAKARHADLLSLPTRPAEDLRALEALGRWLMRFSPGVSLYPPASLFLDATGLHRLFGNLHALRNCVNDALARLRISARVAIAPTPGAAWALAAFGPPRVVLPHELPEVLRPLPVQALRLDDSAIDLLNTLGIYTIDALLQLPRETLSARFGDSLLRRIDQALGHLHEPLIFLQHRMPIRASVEFDGAVESLEVLHLVVRQLVAEVVGHLMRQGLGAREMRLTFRPPYTPPIEKTVSFARPSRNESAIFNLLRCVLETLKTQEGFVAASLFVSAADRLGDGQASLIDAEEERHAAELDHLVERLQARRILQWARLVESHLPERAFTCRDGTVPPAALESNSSFISVSDTQDKEHLRQYGKAPHPNPLPSVGEEEGRSEERTIPNYKFPPPLVLRTSVSSVEPGRAGVGARPPLDAQAPTLTLPGSTELTEVRSIRGGERESRDRTCDCLGSERPLPEHQMTLPGRMNIPAHHFDLEHLPISKDPHLDSPALHRPLCLLTIPKPIRVIVTPSESREGHPISFTADGEVHRLVDVLGPERITGQWWTGHWKTRDYFDALDSTGNRYWLFRAMQTGHWFLHGKFE